MMFISKQYRLAFIHIQKTGGTSIRALLEDQLPDLKRIGGTHDTARQGRRQIERDLHRRCLYAAFVRNPWDRLLSWYSMIERSDRNLKLHHYVHANSHDFPSFITNCTRTVRDYDGKKSFLRNQIDYISNWRGQRLVGFVGRFETLTHDAYRLAERLGLDIKALPHRRRGTHRHYSAYYTDELADIVARRFARDIRAFGYRFERVADPII